jgi:hypothetical protein
MASTRRKATKPSKSKSPKSKSTATKSKSKASIVGASKAGAAELAKYLRAWNEYPVKQVRAARCPCGGEIFEVQASDEGGAKRTCVACEREHLLCDSAEYWDDSDQDECACPCRNETFQLAAGFAFYAGSKDVRWIYIGLRCVRCGQIGVYIDWKIDYSPSHQLLDQV